MAHLKPWLWGALVFALSLALYLPALSYGFINFDDPTSVSEAPEVLRGLSLEGARWAFTTRSAAQFQPLTWLSFQADATLWGPQARGFHLMNAVWHALTCLLLFWGLRRFALLPTVATAAFATLLFAWHPLRVESVVWVTERKDVLSGFFAVVSCVAYLQFLERHKWRWWGAAALGVVLAMFAKPSMVALPGALLLLRFARADLPRAPKELLRDAALLGLLVAPVLLINLHIATARDALVDTSAWQRLLGVADIPRKLARYAQLTLAPVNLSLLYPARPLPTPVEGAAWLAAFAGLVAVAVRFRARLGALNWGAAWFVVAMVPMIGLVAVGWHDVADRFTYWPHVGLLGALVAWIRPRVPEKFRALAAAGVLLGYGSTALARVGTWADPVQLYSDALEADPTNTVMLWTRARALQSAGDLPGALRDFETLERVQVGSHAVQTELGVCLARLGRLADAEPHFARAEAAVDATALDFFQHAVALANAERISEALATLDRAKARGLGSGQIEKLRQQLEAALPHPPKEAPP